MRSALLFLSTAMLVLSPLHAGIPCGWVSEGPCPDCEESNSGCACRLQIPEGGCLCGHPDGWGAGLLRVCVEDDFWWEWDENGRLIGDGPLAPCTEDWLCVNTQVPGGNCGTPRPGQTFCLTSPGVCNWGSPLYTSMRALLVENEFCQP